MGILFIAEALKGEFPIAFMVWDTSEKVDFTSVTIDVYDKKNKQLPSRVYHTYDNCQYINDWVKPFRGDIKTNQLIGKFPFKGNDFQNQNMLQIVHHKMDYNTEAGQFLINQKNVMQASVYFAVRKCIAATWLNDRDQFLYPNNGWQTDTEFQNNCLTFALFTNNIRVEYGTNHWIPFSESDVNAQEKFESNFMSQYIKGKIDTEISFDLFSKPTEKTQKKLEFSLEAQAVFTAGKALYTYYHAQPNVNVNAALYDIRTHFQGRNDNGKMNNKSEDEKYTALMNDLRKNVQILAEKIEPKVYAYGFLK